MARLSMLFLGALAFFLPEIFPANASETVANQFALLMRQVTYDSMVAWLIMLSRRFTFKTAPQYFAIWFLKPLLPRAPRRWIGKQIGVVVQFGQSILAKVQGRLRFMTSTPVLVISSLLLSGLAIFAIHYFFDIYVVVVFGFWPLVRPYAFLGLQSAQHYLFRLVAFLNLEWLVKAFVALLPKNAYEWFRITLLRTYRKMLRWQVGWRIYFTRKVLQMWYFRKMDADLIQICKNSLKS